MVDLSHNIRTGNCIIMTRGIMYVWKIGISDISEGQMCGFNLMYRMETKNNNSLFSCPLSGSQL